MKERIRIDKCKKLRSFTLCDDHPASPATLSFLSEISSPDIHTITLRVESEAENAADLPDVSPLAEPLSSNAMRVLKVLRLAYVGYLDIQVAREKFERELPDVHARGILRVVEA